MKLLKCKCIDETYNGGIRTDEPESIKKLEKDLKIHKLTVSNGNLRDDYYGGQWTYFTAEDDFKNDELIELDRAELDKVYTDNYPDTEIDKRVIDTVTTVRAGNKIDGEITAVNTTYKTVKELLTTEQQVCVETEIELKSKRIGYVPCATNWSGAYNGGTIANGDAITGNVTNADTYQMIISAGATVTATGAYGINNSGRATYVGTATNWIILKSGIAAPLRNSWTGLTFTNIDTNSACQYVKMYHAATALVFNGTTSNTQLTIDHMYFDSCTVLFTNAANNATTQTISNSRAMYGTRIFAGSGSNSNTTILSNCEITDLDYFAVTANTASILSFQNTKIANFPGGIGSCGYIYDCDNSIFMHLDGTTAFGTITTAGNTFNNCLFIGWYMYGNGTTGTATISACDFISQPYTDTFAVKNIGTIDDCYVAGFRNYGISVFDTFVSGTSSALGMFTTVVAITNIRTTRKETFTPASVAESSLGDNGVTIGWTSGAGLIKTKHRIKYGTSSGVYTMCVEPDYDWSNYTGLCTIMTTTPSIALANLKAGTKYYYLAESWDWIMQVWVSAAAEGDFTTTSSAPIITNATISSNTPTTAQTLTIEADISNTPTKAPVITITKSATDIKCYPMFVTVAGHYKALIPCLGTPSLDNKNAIKGIGVCTNATVTIDASNASGAGTPTTVSSTLTVSPASYSIG